jgi:hypothetical protein
VSHPVFYSGSQNNGEVLGVGQSCNATKPISGIFMSKTFPQLSCDLIAFSKTDEFTRIARTTEGFGGSTRKKMDTHCPYVVSQGWAHTFCSMNTLLSYRAKANASLTTHYWSCLFCLFVAILEALPMRILKSYWETLLRRPGWYRITQRLCTEGVFKRAILKVTMPRSLIQKRSLSVWCLNCGESH